MASSGGFLENKLKTDFIKSLVLCKVPCSNLEVLHELQGDHYYLVVLDLPKIYKDSTHPIVVKGFNKAYVDKGFLETLLSVYYKEHDKRSECDDIFKFSTYDLDWFLVEKNMLSESFFNYFR
jgi:hypothetical protein